MFERLIPVDEVLAPLFSVDLQEVWVEVGRIRGQRFISPQASVFIIDDSNEPLVRLVSVHFELFRQRSLDCSLQKLHLVAVVHVIVQNLPLLDLALVHLKLLLVDAFPSNHFFNHVL